MGKPDIEKMERKRDIKGLVKALGYGTTSISKEAKDALGRIGSPAVKNLVKALKKKHDSLMKREREIWKIEMEVRKRGGFLSEIEKKSIKPRNEAYRLNMGIRMILWSLEIIGEPSVDPLTELLKDKLASVRASAARAVGTIGSRRAVEPLSQVLGDSNFDVRCAALEALKKIRDPRATEPVIQCLKDSEQEVRSCAKDTLLELASTEAVEPLIQSLKIPDSDVRHVTIEVLERIGDSRATEPVIEFLKDDDIRVQRGAAKALLKFRDARAVEPLIEALTLPDSVVRCVAAEALELIGDARAVKPLVQVLDDEQQEIRVAAGKALGQLHARGFTMSLTKTEILERVNWKWEYTQHEDAPLAHKYHDCSHHTDTPGRKDRVNATLLSESQMEW